MKMENWTTKIKPYQELTGNINNPFKVAFVRPGGNYSSLIFPDSPRIGIPLGILYIAGALKSDDSIECKVFDALAYPDLDKNSFKKYPYYFGTSLEKLVVEIMDFNPDLVAISSGAEFYFKSTIDTIESIAKTISGIFIVAGGPDLNAQYTEYLNNAPSLNAIVLGEGEETIKDLAECLKNGRNWRNIQNIIYKENNKIIRNPGRPYLEDLDYYFPAYELIDMEHYFNLNKMGYFARTTYSYIDSNRSIYIITSRGCPYECTFCSIFIHMGRPFRSNSSEYVINHIKYLIERYNIRHIHFEDDNLTLNLPRFKRILKGIIDNNFDITWDTPNGVRGDLLDREAIELAKKSGCIYLCFGIESGKENTINEIANKDMNLLKIEESMKTCKEMGIDTQAFYIIGMPGETRRDIEETYKYMFDNFKKYRTIPLVNLFRPLKGTSLYQISTDKGYLINTKETNALEKYGIPQVLFSSNMVETREFDLKYLAKIFQKYKIRLVINAYLGWVKIILSNPMVYIRSFINFFYQLAQNQFNLSKTMRSFFWNKMIYPYSNIRWEGKK